MDPSTRSRIEDLESQLAQIRALAAAAASGAGVPVQHGTALLVNGEVTVAANINALSTIEVTFNTAAGGGGVAEPFTTKLQAPSANRVNGAPGSFDIQALTNNDVINANDHSTVDWIVVG